MKIKSARYFRERYMIDVRHVQPNTGYDPSFIGCNYTLPNKTYIKGFFDLFHGDKENIGNFLSTFLKTAEDGQAIYEFLQNAADCNSTLFYLFYNEKYFLAVNNGNAFNQEGLRSILNVTQSPKSTSKQIGRFGIGFKLVHRLVGKIDGMHEITQDYKGPIMFSWSKKDDLLDLMNHSDIEYENNIDDNSDLPYLLKLILTNFPTDPNEIVKNLQYQNQVLFNKSEYKELCDNVKTCLIPYINTDNLNHGSLFFIRLGDQKKELLDKDYEQNLKTGIEYSLNTLKGLENIKINNVQIKKIPLIIKSDVIVKDSDTFKRIEPEYMDNDIHISIGYNKIDFTKERPFEKVEALKKSPTFYKYFPLGDEIHQSAIFIHCDSLSNEANRRKLHEDSINKALIPEIAKFIVRILSQNRDQNHISNFCQLYANLLLSDVPHDNSDWLKNVYYDIIQNYLLTSIPTQNGFADNVDYVKIKKINTNIPLTVINDNYQWFKWNEDNVDTLLNAAKGKLGIKTLDIVDLIIESNISKLDSWILLADNKSYQDFLNEINSTTRILSSNSKFNEKIRKIKLFKFTDNKCYSYEELIKNDNGNFVYACNKTIYTTNKNEDISEELISLGFIISNVNIDRYKKIKECFTLPKDKVFFELLGASLKNANLSITNKRNIIIHLTTQNNDKKLTDIGNESIRSLYLCHNIAGELVPLGELIGHKYDIPYWLSNYQIKAEEYFIELDKFLISEKDIYSSIIYKYWDTLLVEKDIKEFYLEIKRLYDLNPEHNKNLKGKKYIYTEGEKFVTLDDLIYNSKMLNESLNYKSLNNVITTIFERELPQQHIAKLLEEEPFGLKNDNICDWSPTKNKGVDLNDIKNILKFCNLNNETFFKIFVINFIDGEYYINNRSDNYYQIYVNESCTQSYIKEHYSKTMIPLPNGLEEYKNSEGIVSDTILHNVILKGVEDVDKEKETLIDVVKYEARKKFISKLSEIKIDLDEDTSNESYSFKLLNMAIEVLENTEDIQNFQNKLNIVKNGETFNHDQIPQTIAESFEIKEAKQKFDLAKILPNEYCNGSLLIEIVEKYLKLGLNRNKLKKLFGISEEIDIDSLYKTLISQYTTLQNDQQLAFVLMFCFNNELNVPKFCLIARDNQEYDGDFIVKDFEFISDKYTLSKPYKHLTDYIKLPYGDNTYIYSPYINDKNKFICPGLETKNNDEYNYNKVIYLLEFLKKLHKRDKNKFKSVDWSSIKDALSFDPNVCIFPSKYAIESEKLPNEVEKWVKNSSENKDLIDALGVLTEDSVIVRFRKFLNDNLSEFDCHSLYSIKSKEDLENSLDWLSDKNIFPLNKEKYKTLEIAIEQINKLHQSSRIVLTDLYNIEEINKNSIEYNDNCYNDWKDETGYSIYLYNGILPHIIKIDKYIEDTIFSYCDGNITDNGDNIIYVNTETDLQTAMHHLADNNNINLTREDVYKLFDRNITDLQNQIQRLKEDNQRLRENLPAPIDNVNMEGDDSNDVDEMERIEWNEQARKKVKIRLESEGYKFGQSIGEFSEIPNVIDPNGNKVPLVVKSCRCGKLFINPAEWGTLLKPNAMLWIFDGHNVMPLHLREMIRNQDQLVLKMNTKNLDDVSKVSKFAKILCYFKQVHFNFNSIIPTMTASKYENYAFDDRPMDEKLEEDIYE